MALTTSQQQHIAHLLGQALENLECTLLTMRWREAPGDEVAELLVTRWRLRKAYNAALGTTAQYSLPVVKRHVSIGTRFMTWLITSRASMCNLLIDRLKAWSEDWQGVGQRDEENGRLGASPANYEGGEPELDLRLSTSALSNPTDWEELMIRAENRKRGTMQAHSDLKPN